MDEEEELAKFKLMLAALVAFLISGYFSYQELQYALFGKTATAQITRTFDTYSRGRRGRRIPKLGIEYRYTAANGELYDETEYVSPGYAVPADNQLVVQYRPGVENSSRISGTGNTFWVFIFFGCVAWLAYSGFKLYREASEAVHGPKKKRRR